DPRDAFTLFLVRMVSFSAVAATTPCVDSRQLSIRQELVETLDQKPNRIIFIGKPATLTPESEIFKSSKLLPAKSLSCSRIAMIRPCKMTARVVTTEYRKPHASCQSRQDS